MDLEITIADQPLTLLPQRAAYLIRSRTLVVAEFQTTCETLLGISMVVPVRAPSSLGSTTVMTALPSVAYRVGWSGPDDTRAMSVNGKLLPKNRSSRHESVSRRTTPVLRAIASPVPSSMVTPGTCCKKLVLIRILSMTGPAAPGRRSSVNSRASG